MIIINADDWGRSCLDTDAALECYISNRISSVSAMVFMKDSERAAALANQHTVDVGLHFPNFTEPFTADNVPPGAPTWRSKTGRYLNRNKFALLVYNPALRNHF